MIVGVNHHNMVQLPDGVLLSVGGRDSNIDTVGAIQMYDHEEKIWSLREEVLPLPKSGASVLVPADWCNDTLNN